MNPFNKNPFANKNTNTRIVGNNIQFDEKNKIQKIKENLANLKLQHQDLNKNNEEIKQPSLQEKIEILRNLNKW